MRGFWAAHYGQTRRELVYRPLQFQKRCQDFIGADDETLPVAMCVHNPDCSPFKIERRRSNRLVSLLTS